MKFIKILFILFCLHANNTFGENPEELPIDTIALEEVEISANKLVNFTTGAKVERIAESIKSKYNNSNLSDLLAQTTPLSVKSYGAAGLSNVSLRGMASKHTAILWNGINIQNSMNGGFDMNSIPAFIIDDINIQYGGSGALFGSGAIGGIIHLNNSLRLEKKFEIEFSGNIGSFSNYFGGFKINAGNEKIASSTRIYYKYGKNNFDYVNTQQFGHPELKQENAASMQYGITQSNIFRVNDKQKISTNIWIQHHDLEIPAMTSNTKSEQNQSTDLIRISAMWNRNGEISSWYARFYYNYESLLYKDPAISLVSDLDNLSYITEIENKTSIGNNFLINLGLNNTYEKAITSNYAKDKTRNKTAFYSSLKYFTSNKAFAAVLSFREELIDNKFTPNTYSLSSRYYIHKTFNVVSSYSKTFNIPTFNDLYWVPGGNPDLNSENGWSFDYLGLNYNIKNPNHNLNIVTTGFVNFIKDMTVWAPTFQGYWKAENLEKILSKGIESSINYNFAFKKFKAGIYAFYAYTNSVNISEDLNITDLPDILFDDVQETESDPLIGKHLRYIPMHKGGLSLSIEYLRYNFNFNHNFTSKRYITKDNSSSIDPFTVGDISIGSNFKLRSSSINLQFKVNNVWNKTYEVMAYYAMPLRNYAISIRYNFNKLNNQ
jgi:iron complex outermembrane receptor protein